METSGQPKYDSTSMGGGKMKQLKITKRQAALMLLELCHGFLILFAIYACAVVISGHGSEPFVLVGCLLFPLNAGLFLAEKKATHFWQFGIVTLLLIGGSVMLAGSGVCGIWTGILGVIAAFSYFYGRASKKTCWLKIPSYPWLGIALVLYFLGQHFVSDTAIRIAPVLAALYYLLCNFHINLKEVDSFLKTHASLERLPVRRLAKINQGMMWLVSAVTAVAMIAAPYLGIDQLIRKGGQALKTVIRWLLHLIPNSPAEEGTMAAEQTNQMMQATASREIPWFLELLYKLLDLIGWMIGISLVLVCVFVGVRALYRLYLRFNEKTEENGDKIERLLPPPAAEKKKNLNRKKKVLRESVTIDKNGKIFLIECILFLDNSYEISINDISRQEEESRMKRQLTQNVSHRAENTGQQHSRVFGNNPIQPRFESGQTSIFLGTLLFPKYPPYRIITRYFRIKQT